MSADIQYYSTGTLHVSLRSTVVLVITDVSNRKCLLLGNAKLFVLLITVN